MVQHVYQRCVEAQCFAEIIVATDDPRIIAAVHAFGGVAHLTSPTCASGTDRVAEVARHRGFEAERVLVNVQGDEPAVHPESLKTLAQLFAEPKVEMGTLVRPLLETERNNPNVVKAVLSESSDALYFSRADIPFARDGAADAPRWAHLGLYGYRVRILEQLAAFPATPLERIESLEQLRALGHGIRITCRPTPHFSHAVDTPQDVPDAELALNRLFLRSVK